MSRPLTGVEFVTALRSLPLWSGDLSGIVRTVRFTNFPGAIAFMAAAAPEIDRLGHHPEWTNIYNRVIIRLTTHDAGNQVTDLDVTLAKMLDVVAVAYSVL